MADHRLHSIRNLDKCSFVYLSKYSFAECLSRNRDIVVAVNDGIAVSGSTPTDGVFERHMFKGRMLGGGDMPNSGMPGAPQFDCGIFERLMFSMLGGGTTGAPRFGNTGRT